MQSYSTRVESFNLQDDSIYTSLSRRRSVVNFGSRQEVMKDLLYGIRADEASTMQLLQAFDVAYGASEFDETVLPVHQTPFRPLTNTLHANPSIPRVTDSLLPPKRSENPYLSTPLRAKYFPKLSPSILRHLLSSPSPYAYTSDTSFEVDNDDSLDFSASASLPSIPSLELVEPCATGPQASGLAYPLTPPLTARIPCVEQTPARTQLHSPFGFGSSATTNSRGFYVEGVDNSVPDIKACLSSMTPFAHANNFRLGNARRTSSHCIAEEIRAAGETPEERRFNLMSSLRDPSNRSVPATPASPSRRGSRVQPSRKPREILEQEFAEILEARAIEEENDARELYMMAKRLERLALQRRHLATLMID